MPVSHQAPDSRFAYVVVAAKRARQLMSGAMPLLANPRSHKPTRVALEELNASQLEYRVPEVAGEPSEKDGKGSSE
jgi:DNA-directed RNA polymerase omega subunit